GEVKNFNPQGYLSIKECKRMDLFCQYAVCAAKMALQDSGFEIKENNADRVGVLLGSGIGGIQAIQETVIAMKEKGPKGIGPFFIPQTISNMAAGHVSILLGAKGPNSCVVTACATGAHAIGDAFRWIQMGKADAVLAGGAEAAICEVGVGGFAAMRALSKRNDAPQKASRPFDRDRDGFVIAEGAGVFLLESLEEAEMRGAHFYAEIIGYGMNADAYHMTTPSPNGEGAAQCMKLTLEDANVSQDEVDYINLHGTSTEAGDIAETEAIKRIFKSNAKNISTSSTKSMTGHLLGAAGSVEAAFCVGALERQVVPPTINLDHPDPACDLDYTPHEARPKKLRIVLSNSFGFGGTNAGLLLRRVS
ncbi:MAG: beta-ketoacyl-ACP synthase II, partial [Deltaproteobacteria bacterium]|nr:beta-ketoacyl-ACP synthase II [Deltaproteobacteria bacterium]